MLKINKFYKIKNATSTQKATSENNNNNLQKNLRENNLQTNLHLKKFIHNNN
jgi:hypothetical protein